MPRLKKMQSNRTAAPDDLFCFAPRNDATRQSLPAGGRVYNTQGGESMFISEDAKVELPKFCSSR